MRDASEERAERGGIHQSGFCFIPEGAVERVGRTSEAASRINLTILSCRNWAITGLGVPSRRSLSTLDENREITHGLSLLSMASWNLRRVSRFVRDITSKRIASGARPFGIGSMVSWEVVSVCSCRILWSVLNLTFDPLTMSKDATSRK